MSMLGGIMGALAGHGARLRAAVTSRALAGCLRDMLRMRYDKSRGRDKKARSGAVSAAPADAPLLTA